MDSQSKDFKFFVQHHDELYKLYPNKILVLQNEKVVFVCDTFEKALDAALSSKMKPGTFIVQECTEGEEAYTQSFNSRVVFA